MQCCTNAGKLSEMVAQALKGGAMCPSSGLRKVISNQSSSVEHYMMYTHIRARQINEIKNGNRINNRLMELCKLGSLLIY